MVTDSTGDTDRGGGLMVRRLRHSSDHFKHQVSADSGPSIGNRRTFFGSGDCCWGCSQPRTDVRCSADKAFYKSFCRSKADELLLKMRERQHGPAERAGRGSTQERRGEPVKPRAIRQRSPFVVERWFAEPLGYRFDAGGISPALARFRRNTGERSSTDHSALESREQRHCEGHHVARRRPRQAGFRHAGTRTS